MTVYDLPTIQGLRLIKGLCQGVLLGKDTVAGFPSLHNLPHTGTLQFHGIKVHQSESKGETIVLDIPNVYEGTKIEDLANTLLGSRVYVNYPFLREAKVTAISDSLFRYELDPHSQRCRSIPHEDRALAQWQRSADGIEYELSKKCGMVIGDVDVIVHAKPIKGLQRMEDGALVKEFETRDCDYALQTIVLQVSSVDPRFMVRILFHKLLFNPSPSESLTVPSSCSFSFFFQEQSAKSLTEEFPLGSKVFFLGTLLYGAPGQVVGHSKDKLDLRIMVCSILSLSKTDNIVRIWSLTYLK
jgi:5'-3' exoribonuclease 1